MSQSEVKYLDWPRRAGRPGGERGVEQRKAITCDQALLSSGRSARLSKGFPRRHWLCQCIVYLPKPTRIRLSSDPGNIFWFFLLLTLRNSVIFDSYSEKDISPTFSLYNSIKETLQFYQIFLYLHIDYTIQFNSDHFFAKYNWLFRRLKLIYY